jgi:hypothetical protein
MTRFTHMLVLAVFLTVGFGVPMTFANEPAPAEQKDKKDNAGTKADSEKKDEKRDIGGTKADGDKKEEKKGMGGK